MSGRGQHMGGRRSLLFSIAAVGVLLGGGIGLSAGFALAKGAVRPAEVRAPSGLCTRLAPNGKAQVTPLAEGENAWIGRLEMAPSAKVPEHRDPTEEYIHVLSGRGRMWIDDVESLVEPGATIFMPAGAKVRFENGPTSMTALQVFAGPGPATKYASWTGCP